MRAVCIREVQKDLAQSSKLLLEIKLREFGLGEADGFKVYRDLISTPKDGIIIFKGMNDYSADSIKSLEGFKRGWWEEAQTATKHSLNLYRPTLRAIGAERWFSWNPRRKGDAIEELFGPELPTGALLVTANWRDNPWYNSELERERKDFLRTQPDSYDHIWEGGYVKIVEGAYYAANLHAAQAAGRIGRVSADPLLSYHAFFDIGGTGAKADAVAIWVDQFVGREIRALNYFEAKSQPLAFYVNWLIENGYKPKRTHIWLPHDGEQGDKVFDASYESALKAAGFDVTVVPNQGKGAAKQRIEAGRRQFGSIWFNQETTQPGLDALGWYHEKKDDIRGIGLGPDHDWSSHGADAFGLKCVCADRIFSESAGWGKPIKYSNQGIV
jgi:phage terminase large subunit